jgi:ADP-ribose pyrophosphatase YjhB (NUDIX family)
MTVTDKVLHQNEWLSLHRISDPEGGIGGYVYSHESRCNGLIVAALPYRFRFSTQPRCPEFLLRVEVTPCWGLEPIQSAVTGGSEAGETPQTTMLRELREETGFEVPPDSLILLGQSRGTKSTDTLFVLFAADVTDLEQHPLQGDGSALEASATVAWTERPWESIDPLVSMMWAQLINSREWAGA